MKDLGIREKPARVADLFHAEQGAEFLRRGTCAVLQPCGMYYNRDLTALRKGDRIRFFESVEGVVMDVTELDMTQPIFGILVKWIYGENVRCAEVIERWVQHAVRQGYGKNAVSTRKCLLIRYKVEDRGIARGEKAGVVNRY